MDQPTLTDFESQLETVVKGEVHFNEFTRGIYSSDASIYQFMPVAVVVPLDEEDVRGAVDTARKFRVSILPRGGGTSLGGQAAGPSLVIDFSKYMHRILEISVREKWVRVQPGIVLDELNHFLKPHGLHFAPDPATGNRATIGGMIGNNSSGARSILYGITQDHVLETKTLLSDGSVLQFREFELQDQLRELEKRDGREKQLLNDFKKIIDARGAEIRKVYPKIMRRVQGYNLDSFTDAETWNLSHLMCGSEGTLGIVLEARLNLEPIPVQKALCCVHFKELTECIRSVSAMLEHGPSAVEIMDGDLIRRARRSLTTAGISGWIREDPEGILIVEFIADGAGKAVGKAENLALDLEKRNIGFYRPVISEPEKQAEVWEVRKNGLGLLMKTGGEAKPIGFIEDAAVPLEHLPEYIDNIRNFCREKDVPVLMYAHASVGLLHVRPVLDLKRKEGLDKMKAIARYSFEQVKKYGGSISGEHGDGRTRSPFLEEYFGPEVYDALKEVKRLFDPEGIMNPGIIVDPEALDANLRFSAYRDPAALPTRYQYREEGNFMAAVENCSGVGACRVNLGGLMCPSYRATRDEEHSTRGRANALRLAITGQLGEKGLENPRLYEILDLCLSCKGCKSECPSNVDMAKLKSEFLQHYRERHGTGLRERFVATSTRMAGRMSGWKAPLVNTLMQSLFFRKSLEWVAGIDSRRVLPAYARKKFYRWFESRKQEQRPGKGNARKVVLFDDTYMNYHETRVGIAAVELLESCGYEVILARAGCCQRPLISHGFLKKAAKEGEKTLRKLKGYIDRGLEVVVCEPGCASALTDDLPDLVEDAELADAVRSRVMMIDVFLEKEIRSGNLNVEFNSDYTRLMVHGHCHQKSLYGTTSMENILKSIPGLELEILDSGCCGMAGSFGYEKEHYELSMKVGEDRLFPAVRRMEGETGLVACGFSCRHQIADATGVKARHWVEVLRGSHDI